MEKKSNQPQSLAEQLTTALGNGELVVRETPPEETPTQEEDPKEKELKSKINHIFEAAYQREDAPLPGVKPEEAIPAATPNSKPEEKSGLSPEQEERRRAFVTERLENFQKLVERGARSEEEWKNTLDGVRGNAEYVFDEQEKKAPTQEGTKVQVKTEPRLVVVPHTVSLEEQERALAAVPQEERDRLTGTSLSVLYQERDRLAKSPVPGDTDRASAIDAVIRHKTTEPKQPVVIQEVVRKTTRPVPQKPVPEVPVVAIETTPDTSIVTETVESEAVTQLTPADLQAEMDQMAGGITGGTEGVTPLTSEQQQAEADETAGVVPGDVSTEEEIVPPSVPEVLEPVAHGEEKQIDAEVARKFEEDFKLTEEDLKSLTAEVGEDAEKKILKFEDLTPGQQALLLDNLKAFALDNAKEEALKAHTQKERERYADAKGWRGFVKRAWYGVTKTYRRESELTSGVKEVLENTEGNKEQYKEVLKEMIAQASQAPEVVQNADGTLEIKFAPEKDLGGVQMEQNVKEALEEYNITAGEFMKVRPEWAWSKNPEEQQKYDTAKNNYLSAQTMLEFATDSNGNRVSYEKLISLDKRVRWSQLFNADPKIEEVFAGTKDASAWKEGLKAAMLERGKLFAMGNVSRSLAMALGTASAAVASGGLLGVAGVGALAGSLSGGWIGREMAQKRAKLEIADNKKESEMKMADKLEYAIARMQGAIGTEEEEKISKILADRIYYTEQKLENGLVTSEDNMGGVKSSYALAFALAQARSLINTYATGTFRDIKVKNRKLVDAQDGNIVSDENAIGGRKFVGEGEGNKRVEETGETTVKTVDMKAKIDALLDGQGEKINAEEKKLLQQRVRQGMLLGVVFGGAIGAALAELGTLAHGSKAAEAATPGSAGKNVSTVVPQVAPANPQDHGATETFGQETPASPGSSPAASATVSTTPPSNTNNGLQENWFKKLTEKSGDALDTLKKNLGKNSGKTVDDIHIQKALSQFGTPKSKEPFTDLIHNTKPGEHDSIWRSVRDGILGKPENATKLGYQGKIEDTAALHKWAETKTANLWKEYEATHGGHGKDLVHEGDVVKVDIGADGKAHLEVEYASGKGAGYLHEADAHTPQGGSHAGPELTVIHRAEELPGTNSPLKAPASKIIDAGADTLAEETGISHKHAEEIIQAGSVAGLAGVGLVQGKKIFAEGEINREFYTEKEIDQKNLTARSFWTKEMMEETQKEAAGVNTKAEAEKFVREKVNRFFDELLLGVQQEKYRGGPSMTPDDQKVVMNRMGALYDGIQELRTRFDISGKNSSENERRLFETVEEARKNIKMAQIKFT